MINSNKILVIGDVMLDKYWHSSASALAEDAPVAAVTVDNTEYRAGGATNVALNIKQLCDSNIEVAILAPIGKDADGNKLVSILNKLDIVAHWQISDHNQTITKHRIITDNQQLVRVDFEQKYQPIELNNETKALIEQYKVIVISDYNKGTLDHAADIIQYARSLNKIVLADPKGHDFSKYKNATLLTPNLKEFSAIVGEVSKNNIHQKALLLLQELELEHLLVTLSADGMTLYNKDGSYYHACSYADHVYDVTGAGDTVIASLAVSLNNDINKFEAIEYASHAAALVVSQLGTGFTTPQAVKQLMTIKAQSIGKVENGNKIVHVTNSDQLRQLKELLLTPLVKIFNWDYKFNNILTVQNVQALQQIAEKSKIEKICVIITNNVGSEKQSHSVEELAYMLSILEVTDKVVYSSVGDISKTLENYSQLQLQR